MTSQDAQAQVHISVYARIPLAPDVTLTVGEPYGIAPSPDHIWVDGYWSWDNYRREYVWVQGYWALAPYSGAYWLPGYWEHYRGGYRWIVGGWMAHNYRMHYGYYAGRYDYYGRPVYYHRPHNDHSHGYAYGYDHRPEHRRAGFSSSSRFNSSPREDRERINKEYATRRASSSGSTQNRSERTQPARSTRSSESVRSSSSSDAGRSSRSSSGSSRSSSSSDGGSRGGSRR
ncbi:hypothetical protein FACS1894162_2110 [Bacteroidia bacterium]|nr:hypothetical protein FACS1894162_2110 [Bacteroidia bacterium]